MSSLRLWAEIKWCNDGPASSVQLKKYMENYLVDRDRAHRKFKEFRELPPEKINTIFMAVRCGPSPKGSIFLFLRGTQRSSEIYGICLTDILKHLLKDWDFLKDKMNESNVQHKVREMHVRLNDERLLKTSFLSYLKRKAIIAFLFSSAGLCPLISAVILKILSLESIVTSSVGFILWLIISYIGHRLEGEYILER